MPHRHRLFKVAAALSLTSTALAASQTLINPQLALSWLLRPDWLAQPFATTISVTAISISLLTLMLLTALYSLAAARVLPKLPGQMVVLPTLTLLLLARGVLVAVVEDAALSPVFLNWLVMSIFCFAIGMVLALAQHLQWLQQREQLALRTALGID